MQCPACLKELKAESLHGQCVDRCADCGGLWLAPSELGALVQHTEPTNVSAPPAAPGPGEMVCPKCGEILTAFNYAHDSGVFIKKCASCGGIWLESGQLERIVQYRVGTPADQALASVLADEKRTSRRLLLVRRLLRSRLLSSLVVAGCVLVVLRTTGSIEFALRLLAAFGFPMLCIWIPDTMGNLKGVSFWLLRPVITQTSPGDFVALAAWVLLFCQAVVVLTACL